MIDEILEVLGHSARNLDDTLAQYVLAQYEAEVKKTQDSLLEEKKAIEIEEAVYLSNSDNLKKEKEEAKK
jgi:hypothetical protein